MILQHDVDLTACNTLALPGRAALFCRIDNESLLAAPELRHPRRFVLGGGSNLVLTGDFDGLVLQMAIPGRRLLGEDADFWYLEAGAGENWHDFVQWTLNQGRPGLENLSLIPGTVGAAPIQNIGAYGLEVGERVHRVTAYDASKDDFVTFAGDDCRFAYRNSVFKDEGWHLSGCLVITAVTFKLPKAWHPVSSYGEVARELDNRKIASPSPKDIADSIIAIRQRKLPDPRETPNAGSFFHNPVVEAATADTLAATFPLLPRYPQPDGRVKLAAGWLIEEAGWKGRFLGPAGMYEKQALVLVNRGGARGDDVCRTMAAVQADVLARFGIQLTPEPVFL